MPISKEQFKEKYYFVFVFLRNVNLKYPNLLPFQKIKDVIKYKINLSNLYKEIDHVISYYYYDWGNIDTLSCGPIIDLDLPEQNISIENANSEYDFHFLCKLNNGCWLYMFIKADFTLIIEDNCILYDDCKLYVHPNLSHLIKYGIETKYYPKLGII
ncbi:hypothetical protein OAA60_01325 [Porticoccaceae bacterium]|nr:hypothetical protein [Porticoccaceae bacterium]